VGLARSGGGPTLVESKIYRLSAHGNIIAPPGIPLHFPEHEAVAVFGAADEYAAARRADPLLRMRSRLVSSGALAEEEADAMAAEVREEMAAAVEFALASPYPAPDEALRHVYA
jgi:TPP-dependent pyruvate/acetoin dehydrogenase alpha subunit